MSSSSSNFGHSSSINGDPYQAYYQGRYRDAYNALDDILQIPLFNNQQQMDPYSLWSKCMQRINLHYLQLDCMMQLCHRPLEELKARIEETKNVIKNLPLPKLDMESNLKKIDLFNENLTERQQATYRFYYALGLRLQLLDILEKFSPLNAPIEVIQEIIRFLVIIAKESEMAGLFFADVGRENAVNEAGKNIIIANEKAADWLVSTGYDYLEILQLSSTCYEICIRYYQGDDQSVVHALHLKREGVQQRIVKLENSKKDAAIASSSSSLSPSVKGLEEAINSRIEIEDTPKGQRFHRVIDYWTGREKKLKIKKREIFPLSLDECNRGEKLKEDELELEQVSISAYIPKRVVLTKEQLGDEDDKEVTRTVCTSIHSLMGSSAKSSSTDGKTSTAKVNSALSSSSPAKRRRSCVISSSSEAVEDRREDLINAITAGNAILVKDIVSNDETWASKPIIRGTIENFLMYAIRVCPKESVAAVITALLPGSLMDSCSINNLFSHSTKCNANGDLMIQRAYNRGIVKELLTGLKDAAKNASGIKIKKSKKSLHLSDLLIDPINLMINNLLISNHLPSLGSYFSAGEPLMSYESETEAVSHCSDFSASTPSPSVDRQAMNVESSKSSASSLGLMRQGNGLEARFKVR